MQPCTFIRAQREEWRLSPSISVYATLTPTKVQAFYQCRLGALRIRSTLTAFGQKTTFSGLSFRGFLVAPSKNATLHCQSRPKRRTKWQYNLCIFFTPSERTCKKLPNSFRWILLSCYCSFSSAFEF